MFKIKQSRSSEKIVAPEYLAKMFNWEYSYATRQADATRSQGEDPLPGSGVIAEVITSGSNEAVLITPGVMGFNNDSPRTATIYASVTNRSNAAAAITVTLTALKIGE